VSEPGDSPSRGEQLAPAAERRRSQRVVIRIPVRLRFNLGKKEETLEARTVVVNDHGALLICSRVFPVGTPLEVENLRNQRRQLCRVLRVPRITDLGFEVPIEFESAAPGFWGISFPPPGWEPGTG
jgi:hypothetical protein